MIALIRITHIKILKSPSLWISLVFVAFFLAFSPKAISSASINPNEVATQISAAIIITGLLMVVMTTFGESFVKIKSSLIYQNVELNNKPRFQFYIATILPVVVFSISMFITSMLLLVIFDAIGLIGTTSNIINWSNVNYLYLLISIITTVTLGISIALLFATLSKTENVYTALVWAYLFLVFFFGGSSVPIFLIRGDDPLKVFKFLSMLIPNTYSNFLFVNSMSGSMTFSSGFNATYFLDIVMPMVLSASFILIRQLVLKRIS